MSRSGIPVARGSFYYIKVGDQFFAGFLHEAREVLEEIKDPRPRNQWDGFVYRGVESRTRLRRQVRAGRQAEYLKPTPKKQVMRRELTGRVTARLSGDIAEAKKYRKKPTALNACERVRGVYGTLTDEIEVVLKEEESS